MTHALLLALAAFAAGLALASAAYRYILFEKWKLLAFLAVLNAAHVAALLVRWS